MEFLNKMWKFQGQPRKGIYRGDQEKIMWNFLGVFYKFESFPNAEFIFITFKNCDNTCSKIEKTWFLLGWWQKSLK